MSDDDRRSIEEQIRREVGARLIEAIEAAFGDDELPPTHPPASPTRDVAASTYAAENAAAALADELLAKLMGNV
jgi:hypothetical protein